MDLNDGRFQDNGGCGYVLKPAVLMFSHRSFDPGCSRHDLKPTHLLLKVGPPSGERRTTPATGVKTGAGVLCRKTVHVHVCVCLMRHIFASRRI